jgi:hypothetical protein
MLGGVFVEHLVRFTTGEGREGLHVAKDLDEALRFTERLRNTEEATDVRLYRLQELAVEFKVTYRAEVRPADGEAAAEGASVPAPPTPLAPAERPIRVAAAPANDAESSSDGGRRLFGRS